MGKSKSVQKASSLPQSPAPAVKAASGAEEQPVASGKRAPPRSMKNIGYAIDALFVVGVAYAISQFPVWRDIQQQGLVGFVANLPTPIHPLNATGVLVEMNARYGVVSPSVALTSQKWWNYIAGDDLGARAVGNPDVRYYSSISAMLNSWILPSFLLESLPQSVAGWMRNMIAAWALYFIAGGLWCLWIYRIKGAHFFKSSADMPTTEDLLAQIDVSSSAIVWYSLAPSMAEWLIERGWTSAYASFDQVGGVMNWLAWTAFYLLFVEWGIYWAHRILHIRALYPLHKPHHIYSNRNVLSPFAGLAFHPLDGLVQASPYTFGLFLMPVHYWTHLVMLFCTAVWTTNIHDTLTGDTEPVMGSAYHTIHHTAYDYNYGQIFILFDWLHDTLVPPAHRKQQWGWEGRAAFMRGKQGTMAKIHDE